MKKLITLLALIIVVVSCETEIDDSNNNLPLASPKSVQPTGLDGALLLQWTKVAPAQGVTPYYKMYYSTSNNSAGATEYPQEIDSGTSNLVTGTITALTNDTEYYVWVKSIFPGLGESNYSPTSVGKPIPPPGPPSAVQVYASEEALELEWTGDDHAFTYNVECTDPSGNVYSASSGAEGVFITGLTNGTIYTLQVRSVNTAGVSEWVSASSGTPALQGILSAPSPVFVTSGNNKLSLQWEQIQGAPKYQIYYSTSVAFDHATKFDKLIPADSPTVRADLTGNTTIDWSEYTYQTGLKNGTDYYVWVTSVTEAGESPPSTGVSGTPAPKTAIQWTNMNFKLGTADSDYPFAQNLPDSVFFPGGTLGTDRLTRVQETALGDLYCDAGAWYARTELGQVFDFVFMNGGFIDNGLLAGDINVGTFLNTIQSDARSDKIVIAQLTGAQLKDFLGTGTSPNPDYSVAQVIHTGRGGAGTGNFGIISSELSYTIQYPIAPTTKPAGFIADPYYHGRIKDDGRLKLRGRGGIGVDPADIDENQTYRILTTDGNASGYFASPLGHIVYSSDVLYWHAVAEYIYDQGTITPKLDGRIKLEGGVPLPSPWVEGDWRN